ncbi:rod shape-determining protein MreD [Robertkochia solimangrovi]|uniref:rod shape-determining protein MreD n=1 Tax=Robertkochia solimangrovi TaxID=2213046 RepID=UPI00118098DA|nr:rod shape-determining protein MreD [Robertkochia solimangrovi]TRZ43239.1 rod shape-determining protein MreD [Robertkochia solimangrovi]
MNNTIVSNITRFIILVLLQVTLFNHIDFLGYLNPYIYILFIVYFPFDKETRIPFLFFSFLIGLSIDIFSDSGGVHSAASVAIAYLRPVIMRWAFGLSYDYQTLKISKTTFGQRFNFLSLLILTHHLILFTLEIFSFAQVVNILKKTIFSAIFTLILCLIFISLFSRKRS